ncbi:MAG: DNA mismatch repair endonuclease MutL [Eubacterium sp.]|nr:DNA mismatch repair endonuclease MutL [Eubacterium sp.]
MIHLLDSDTIDKIAAGEVIERPAAVVKELVENSIDAGANAITVEIKKGGISFIRITDNGMGIEKEDIPIAFERHATSKIKDINDLLSITSLGFRGEALSSIASVSQVELITKAKHAMVGNRYEIHGGKKISFTEVGAPDGTTFIVRNIFYNTPARLKFLKSERTESTRIGEVMMHFALSHPDIRFNFIVDGKNKLNTSGNGNVKNNIFSQYGSDIAKALLPIDTTMYDMRLSGYIGKPEINRNTRSLINTYINGRVVKSPLLFKAIESGFSGYVMGGRFPFATLFLEIESSLLDVNVHPTKMEVRFMNQEEVYDLFANSIKEALKKATVIPEVTLAVPKEPEVTLVSPREPEATLVSPREPEIPVPVATANPDIEEISYKAPEPFEEKRIEEAKKLDTKKMQQNMLELINNKEERNIFKEETEESFRLIGQVFGTYWMIEYNDEMLIIDQHAAHEKVLYEKIIKDLKDRKIYHQQLLKPVVITLTAREKQLIDEYRDAFYDLGFEIEDFGGDDIAVTTVSYHFIKLDTKELFYAILDGLLNDPLSSKIELITDRCATIACKAAVKGNNVLSFREAEELIREMLRADEPYHCPHGRPTTISMSKYEFDKKFKRIV